MIHRKYLFAIALGLELVNAHGVEAQMPILDRLVTPSTIANLRAKQRNTPNDFEPPPEENAPEQTAGGGSRNDRRCSTNSNSRLPLTALLPQNGLGLTLKARPTLPVYIPNTTANNLELSLFDANHQGIYQTSIKLPDREKAVGIELPQAAPELQVDREYYWSIAMICDPSDRLKDLVVTGRVKRIESNNSQLQRKLELVADRPLRQILLYRKSGLWYEMMSTFLEYQKNEPLNSQLKVIWQDLLASSGLDNLTIKKNSSQK